MYEPIPIGAAAIIWVAALGASTWLLLTAFHPSFRKVAHWGRMNKGPVASRVSLVTAAIALPLFFGKLFVDGYYPSWTTPMQWLAGLSGAAVILSLICDLFRDKASQRTLLFPFAALRQTSLFSAESATKRPFLSLWDFGWIDQDQISLPGIQTAAEVPAAYYQSREFDTSFIGQKQKTDRGIHGPFRTDALSESDFILLTVLEFRAEIARIRQPETFYAPATDEQWLRVEALTSELCDKSTAIYMLRFTEQDRDRFHEMGWVLHFFREFICIGHDLAVTRVVIGYD